MHGKINIDTLLITYERYKLVGKAGQFDYMVQPELMSFDTAIKMDSNDQSFQMKVSGLSNREFQAPETFTGGSTLC